MAEQFFELLHGTAKSIPVAAAERFLCIFQCRSRLGQTLCVLLDRDFSRLLRDPAKDGADRLFEARLHGQAFAVADDDVTYLRHIFVESRRRAAWTPRE